jgi:hypothetical protein
LVESASERRRANEERERAMPGIVPHTGTVQFFDNKNNAIQIYDGLCLLTGHSEYDKLVDDDIVYAVAYPNGQYAGGTKTVRQFTCNIDAVSSLADTAQMKALKAPRPD